MGFFDAFRSIFVCIALRATSWNGWGMKGVFLRGGGERVGGEDGEKGGEGGKRGGCLLGFTLHIILGSIPNRADSTVKWYCRIFLWDVVIS